METGKNVVDLPRPAGPARLSGETKLSCRNLWKVYGHDPDYYFDAEGYTLNAVELAERMRHERHIPAVADVSFQVETGEIFVIMGLSGSGKSTVLRCLSRLVEPSAGQVMLDGTDLLKVAPRELIEIRRHKMGMVFQNFGLLPHLTVLENVAFPLKAQGIGRPERQERAREMIELVGLKGREGAFPRQLSGGQQQRVGIARSLAVGPEVWFLDEPFSALDPLIRRQMQDEFMRLQRKLHKTIVFITHDFLEALRIADHIAIMKDGFLVQVGTPEDIVLNPADDYVREFTRDVPAYKVFTAGAVMVERLPPGKEGAPRPEVPAGMRLEEAIGLFDAGVEVLDVVRSDGRVVGSLTPRSILGVMLKEQPEGRRA